MSPKECLSQITPPPWGIFTVLLLDDATFKQSGEDGLLCPKLRPTERRRATERLQLVTQLMMQDLRGTWTKASLGHPCGREKPVFWELGTVLGKLGERGSSWPLLPSRLFPHICEVSDETIEKWLGLFPLGWHISVPHQSWPVAWDHGPHLVQSFWVAKVMLGDTNDFYMWFHSFMP